MSEVRSRPGPVVQPAAHSPAYSYVDANGISQVSRRSFPCLCSVPGPRSNRRALATCGHVDAAPAALTAKASAMADFGANTQLRHLLPYASRVALPHTCKARFRLVGWPLPGGRRTLWTAARGFSSCRSSSSPALLTQQRSALPAERRARAPRLSFFLLPKRGAERREGANLSRLRGAPNHACEAWLASCDRRARLSALHRGDFEPGAALPSPAFPPESGYSELLAARS